MPAARATREAAGLTTIHDDVWTFKPSYRALTDAEVYADQRAKGASHRVALIAAGLIASPPCQTFSTAGKGSGRKALDDVLAVLPNVATMTLAELRQAGEAFGDDRTALVLTPLWFALHHPYRWLAWEQVPTVLPVWEACAEVLRAEGWNVWAGKLHAEQYGVPQTRTRAFLLASRDLEVTPPTPTHSRYYSRTPGKLDPGVAKWVPMAEALPHLAGARVVSNYGTGGDPAARGVRTTDQPAATVTSKVDRNRWYREGTTARGVAQAAGDRHPDSRRVTVAEAGVLQTFPADHPWQGNQSKQFLQAGNAVPPLLAMAALSAALGEPYVPPAMYATADAEQPALDGLCQSPSGVTGPVHRPVTHPAATVTGADNYYIHPTSQCHKLLASN